MSFLILCVLTFMAVKYFQECQRKQQLAANPQAALAEMQYEHQQKQLRQERMVSWGVSFLRMIFKR